ncbi:CBS domain-containing protein [Acetomicrobium sp.]|uniref:CBS domain-containing protein n=1 Tax=Acetomicrobium sp. TaxID=1872099 RepID=UPI0028716040|nr:CBS domain-containing protein [Acetomicrobium sp.]MDR9770087.1 CBS domain-containing protein [Acetomicrobium sp.]
MSSPELMTAEDVMIKDPVKAHPKRTLAQAVEIMRSHGVDSVLIVDEDNKLFGIATARDISERFDEKKVFRGNIYKRCHTRSSK